MVDFYKKKARVLYSALSKNQGKVRMDNWQKHQSFSFLVFSDMAYNEYQDTFILTFRRMLSINYCTPYINQGKIANDFDDYNIHSGALPISNSSEPFCVFVCVCVY